MYLCIHRSDTQLKNELHLLFNLNYTPNKKDYFIE